MISPTEAKILSLLIARPKGCYASELLHASGGTLKRGSVYTTLTRMEQAGLVKATEEPATETYALPRTSYRISGDGIAAHREFGVYTGFIGQGVLA